MTARTLAGLTLWAMVALLFTACAAPAPKYSAEQYCAYYGSIWRPGLGFCGADGN